jgi:predicted  nucleic acid-binding Zn-ribbon protein
VKEQIATLVELQGIDDQAVIVRNAMTASAQKVEAVRGKVAAVSAILEEAKQAKALLQRRQRELDLGIEENNALTQKSNDRLMTIKNNREYRALLREIEESQKKTSAMEDELVEVLDKIEAADKEVRRLADECKVLDDALVQEQADTDKELSACRKKLSSLSKERSSLASLMDPGLYKRYTMILEYRNGKAVVPVQSYVCRGCHMNIPPQTYNELQRQDAIMYCPHCERIIYYLQG